MQQSLSSQSLLEHFKLKKEDYNLEVSDRHINDISRSHCRGWKFLPPHLEMKNIVMEDIDRGPGSEEDKRRSFLLKWKQTKGCNATYERLVSALLQIECRRDAESVCKLLKESISTQLLDVPPATSRQGAIALDGM